jgi:hypothetical protein
MIGPNIRTQVIAFMWFVLSRLQLLLEFGVCYKRLI